MQVKIRPKLPRLPAFVDGKDDLDSQLLRFERFANTMDGLRRIGVRPCLHC